MDTSQDKKSILKLAQLHAAIKDYTCDMRIVKKILEKEGNINCTAPVLNPSKALTSLDLAGCTALHLSCRFNCKDLFMYLLNNGAAFTIKNKNNQTVLHTMISRQGNVIFEPLDEPMINAVLSAHLTTNNSCNPINEDGLSHFHIACMTTNSNAVQFFLNNNVSIDESLNANSKKHPGCTPLHIAATCTNTKVAETLLAYGADMHIADANGKTPLHVLIERRMAMFDSPAADSRSNHSTPGKDLYLVLQKQIQENDKIINMLMENMSTDIESIDSIGLSCFHVACMLQNISVAENLADRVTDINQCINKDSPLWPGYTAMHFAAHFNIKTVMMLMEKGANIELHDSKGQTALDICIDRYEIGDICQMMFLNPKWKDILFSDGRTKLTSVICALTGKDNFKGTVRWSNINIKIPMDSSLWPGYTPLHLVVLFAERTKRMLSQPRVEEKEMHLQIIRYCLREGSNSLNNQDSQGRTALHLAFRLKKVTIVDLLFRHGRPIYNVIDKDNLSHLHIACASSRSDLKLKKLVLNNPDVNSAYKGTSAVGDIKPNFTPLHACIVSRNSDFECTKTIKALVKHGADPYLKDAYGLTPIHWMLDHRSPSWYESRIKGIFKKVPHECLVEEYNVSYLHVACVMDDVAIAKRLIKNGADVNLAINYPRRDSDDPLSFLSRIDKCSPLHLCRSFLGMQKLLLYNGADVFVKNAEGETPLSKFGYIREYFSKVHKDIELQLHLKQEYGWTKLHLACASLQIDGLLELIKAEPTAINARVFSNSPIWKEYTPLHIFNYYYLTRTSPSEDVYTMLRILLDNGADVTMIDDKDNTAISLLFGSRSYYKDFKDVALLMEYHKNFNINPTNSKGISHFHIACQVNDVDVVRGFLMNGGVDVNRPINYFNDYSNWCPGYTPLHLASKLEVVDLLISYGADINMEDVHGLTPLHVAAMSDRFDEKVITKLIESGADINCMNFSGTTPFEVAISKGEITIEMLKFFIEQGCPVNSCNSISGEGYLSMILTQNYKDIIQKNLIVEAIMNESSMNIFGRTTLHHLVTNGSFSSWERCVAFVKKLLKSGHDIEEQDGKGKTALHLAINYQNSSIVKGLLTLGADINVLDHDGNSAIACAFVDSINSSTSVRRSLSIHACRMALLKLDLNENDLHIVSNAAQPILEYARCQKFYEQIELSKEIQLGVRSMHLYDFLSETRAVVIYPSLNITERSKLDEYFDSLGSDKRFDMITSILMLQYRKAVQRLKLLSSALNPLRSLLGFNFPDLCANNMFQYLCNSDLKNIIHANIETEQVSMDVD